MGQLINKLEEKAHTRCLTTGTKTIPIVPLLISAKVYTASKIFGISEPARVMR